MNWYLDWNSMKTYLVGGAVRDLILGIEPKDKDYVVVGSSPEEMIAAGFYQVGAEFPVFINPETNEEYALARKERKSGHGYHGFDVEFSKDVTLEEDLSRRDLTMNSIAMDESGNIIDPYGGVSDINARILRHTSLAFADDPVRILRIVRFSARYGFNIHYDTHELMYEMVRIGEFDNLNAERVWKEFERAFIEPYYWKIWNHLININALERLPFYEKMDYNSFEAAADAQEPLVIRCAAMFKNCSNVEFKNNRIPVEISDLALCADKTANFIKSLSSETIRNEIVMFFNSVDIYRKPDRFEKTLLVLKYRDVKIPESIFDWKIKLLSVDSSAIAQSCSDKSLIKDAINEARIQSI